jgi:hypothetical protein
LFCASYRPDPPSHQTCRCIGPAIANVTGNLPSSAKITAAKEQQDAERQADDRIYRFW